MDIATALQDLCTAADLQAPAASLFLEQSAKGFRPDMTMC